MKFTGAATGPGEGWKTMKTLFTALCAALFTIGLLAPATAASAGIPCSVRPFTAATQYMSIAGYLRWQHFQQDLAWATRTQTAALARQHARYCAEEER